MFDHFDVSSHIDDNGLVIQSRRRDELGSLSHADLMLALADHGYVLLRGFESSQETFSELIKDVSSRITLDPARKFAGGNVAQKIEAGLVPQGLHVENGATPWVPDLVWFYCERPADVGSQTTICDGYRVWERLPERTRRRFLEQRITFSRDVPEDKWKGLVLRLLDGKKSLEQITFDDLLEVTDDHVDAKYLVRPGGAVHYKYFTHAAHPTLFGDAIAFANSILTPSINYEPPVIEFEDGSPLDAMLMRQILEATELETNEIDWRIGDVVLVDNSRVMHGRRKVRDPKRSLYNAQSYIRRSLVDTVRSRREVKRAA